MVAVIPRSTWGARYADGGGAAPVPFTEWWLHHSVTVAPDLAPPFDDEYAAMRTLEAIGQQRFGQGISYTWPIMPNGRVYEGHGVDRLGAHTGGRNSRARAICLVGNYDADEVTPQQIEAAAQLMVQEHRAGRATRHTLNGGHRDLKQTTCPGRYGYAAIPAINARAEALWRGAPARPIEEDDMPLTTADIGKIWMAGTFDPVTGKASNAIDLLKAAVSHAYAGRVAAEQGKAIAEAQAKAGHALSLEDVQRIAEATAAEVAEDLSEGYDLTATPKPAGTASA